MNNTQWILLSCAEQSGDMYASYIIKAIQSLKITIPIKGLGGPLAKQAGMTPIIDYVPQGIMGITEVLKQWRVLKKVQSDLMKALENMPKAVILIDSSSLHLPIAKKAKSLGIPVIYFIPPKVWAWGRWRAKKLNAFCDQLICLYQFETKFLNQMNLPAVTVKHPLLDTISPSSDYEANTIAICPGSRAQEITACLPHILKAAQIIQDQREHVKFSIMIARPAVKALIESYLVQYPHLNCALISKNRYVHLRRSHFAIAVSGTMTLELAFSTTPMIIVYRCSKITAFILKRLVRIPYVGLPNLIANQCIVPELIQEQCTSDQIVTQALRYLDHPNYTQSVMRQLEIVRKICQNKNTLTFNDIIKDTLIS